MTDSRGSLRLRGASRSQPARHASQRFSSTFVGWLIQTAVIAVVQGICDTFYESRGFTKGLRPDLSAKLLFSLKFYQLTLISKVLGQKSNLSTSGRVAGERHAWRAVLGWL